MMAKMPAVVESSSALRVAIVGAGAIGLDLAGALIEAGGQVALLARGANLEALSSRGLELRGPGERSLRLGAERFECAEQAEQLGVRDVVLLTLKSGVVDELWPTLEPLIGPQTLLISAMNGLPRWLAKGRPAIARHLHPPHLHPPQLDAHPHDAPPLDAHPYPGVEPERFAAACVNRNAARVGPGVVQRFGGRGIVLGGLHGRIEPRLRTFAELDRRGYQIELSGHIERELWHKLMINAAFNPLSVLCECALDEMVTTPPLLERLRAVLEEVHALGRALELVEPGSFDVEACFARFASERQGALTSMLRDYQAGQLLELDRIVRAPLWLAARPSLAQPMPALARLLSEVEDKAGPLARGQTSPDM